MKYIICLSLFFISLYLEAQISLTGKISLSPTWAPKIYVSRILSLDDMHRCSEQMIIAESKIDSFGNFRIELPPIYQPQIVRLHISKVDAPAAMLIIGSEEENHGFYALGEKINYDILPDTGSSGLFTHFSIEDDLNQNLNKINHLVEDWNKMHQSLEDEKEQEKIRLEMVRHLFLFSDTSSHLLACIFALRYADLGFNRKEVDIKMEQLVKRLGKHPYLSIYPKERQTKNLYPLLYTLLLVLIVIGFFAIWKQIKTLKAKKKIDLLSPQERKVAKLLINGKTNKEIAATLHVEVSTVKSHIYKIFNKLEIESRKEVNRFITHF